MLIVNDHPDECMFLYRNETCEECPITMIYIEDGEQRQNDFSEQAAWNLACSILALLDNKKEIDKDNESKLGSAPVMDKKLRDLIKNVYDSLR